MRRYRISQDAFEGLLFLQQQDLARAQQKRKPSDKALKAAEQTQHAAEREGSAGLAEASSEIALPVFSAAHKYSTVADLKLLRDSETGAVIPTSVPRSRLVPNSRVFNEVSQQVAQAGCVALEGSCPGSETYNHSSRRLLGYLVLPSRAAGQVTEAARIMGRLDFSDWMRILPLNGTQAEMAKYLDRFYGGASALVLQGSARRVPETAVGDGNKLILLRRNPFAAP